MKIKDNQSVFDIAIQHGGSLDSAFELSVKNNVSVSGTLTPGQSFEGTSVTDRKTVDYLNERNSVPASASASDVNRRGGIGYMSIGKDFKIG